MSSAFAHPICTRCGAQYERDRRVNVCPACGAALFARYHPVRLDRDAVAARPHTIWRWSEMMG
jgi:predicted  nucleic acid-binding Zn-ribbon protein